MDNTNIHNVPNVSTIDVYAIIVRRRSMGKNLAFLHVKIVEGKNEGPLIDGGMQMQETEPMQVVFRRKSTSWDSSHDNFPVKNSQLPYGALVRLQLYQCQSSDQNNTSTTIGPKYEVHQWSILVDPREEATDHAKASDVDNTDGSQTEGISCTKYFTSRMNQYLKYNGQSQSTTRTAKESKVKVSKDIIELPINNEIGATESESHGNKKHKALRAKVFASFLIEKFGRDFFEGSGVLDIAGGKGQLSLELSLQSQSYCTIIDPLIRGKKDTQQFHARDVKRIQKANGNIPKHSARCFVLNDECLELVRQSSCIVGLHPDECTEDIFDAALELNKPSAIIPCCVFASLSPLRKMKNGDDVVTYEQFLDYLMEKDERIARFSLPFQGKNQVLLFDPRLPTQHDA